MYSTFIVDWSGTFEIFANLIQTLSSEAKVLNPKHAVSRGVAPVRGVGGAILNQFYFSQWSLLYKKFVNFSMKFEYKIDLNSKNKNRKIKKLIFQSFKLIAHLSYKFDNIWMIFFCWSATHLKIQGHL